MPHPFAFLQNQKLRRSQDQKYSNQLQFEDSEIAEGIMLHFAKMDAPALPIHDSFIMHNGYGFLGELEEAMRRTFYDRFHQDIKVKHEIVTEIKREDFKVNSITFGTKDLDVIIDGDKEYSRYEKRLKMWWDYEKN